MTHQPTDDRLAALAAACAAQIADHVGPWQEMRPHDQGVILAALRTVRAEAARAQLELDCAAVCVYCRGRNRYLPAQLGDVFFYHVPSWVNPDNPDGRTYRPCQATNIRSAALAALPDAAGGEGE